MLNFIYCAISARYDVERLDLIPPHPSEPGSLKLKDKIHRILKIRNAISQMKTNTGKYCLICSNLKHQVSFDIFGLRKLGA